MFMNSSVATLIVFANLILVNLLKTCDKAPLFHR